MAKLKRKDIAELANKSVQYIGVQIQRGKLIEKDKLIDTNNLTNKAFLSKYITKDLQTIENKNQETNNKETNNHENEKTLEQGNSKVNQGNIDYIIKQYDLKLKTVKVKAENLELDKKKAKVMPIEFVKEMLQRYVNGTFGDVINEGNKLIDDICNETGAEIEVKLKYKKDLNNLVTEILKSKHKIIKEEVVEYAKEFALKTKW